MTAAADRVFLTRHGRTALNAKGRLRGLSDPPLDDVGIAEAARLGEALAPKHPTMVICSPLQRAEVEHDYGSVDSAPGVEPLQGLIARAQQAFVELVTEYGPGPLVVVSHDAFNRAMLGQIDSALAEVRSGHPDRSAAVRYGASSVNDIYRKE